MKPKRPLQDTGDGPGSDLTQNDPTTRKGRSRPSTLVTAALTLGTAAAFLLLTVPRSPTTPLGATSLVVPALLVVATFLAIDIRGATQHAHSRIAVARRLRAHLVATAVAAAIAAALVALRDGLGTHATLRPAAIAGAALIAYLAWRTTNHPHQTNPTKP